MAVTISSAALSFTCPLKVTLFLNLVTRLSSSLGSKNPIAHAIVADNGGRFAFEVFAIMGLSASKKSTLPAF